MDNNFDHVLRDQISWTLGFLILATAKVSLKFQVNRTMFDHAIGRTARNQPRGYTQIFSKLTGDLPFPVEIFTLIFPEILGDLPFPSRGYTQIFPKIPGDLPFPVRSYTHKSRAIFHFLLEAITRTFHLIFTGGSARLFPSYHLESVSKFQLCISKLSSFYFETYSLASPEPSKYRQSVAPLGPVAISHFLSEAMPGFLQKSQSMVNLDFPVESYTQIFPKIPKDGPFPAGRSPEIIGEI